MERKAHTPEPNMTPMIDVIFLLIIFFMTVTEMGNREFSEDVLLPDASTAVTDRDAADDRIVVNVLADGSWRVGGQEKTETALRWDLEREAELSKKPDGRVALHVVIRADKRVSYGRCRKLLNLCAGFGIRNISFHAGVPGEETNVGS